MSTGANKKRLIVVLGMHRSGTSAITSGLVALGVELGDILLPPVPGDNVKGYWEDAEIHALNKDILACLNRKWSSLLPPDGTVMMEKIPAELTDRAFDLIHARILRFPVFGLKDPRLCLLLPFWQKIFRALDLDVGYVIALRHPLSVACSLAGGNRRGEVPPVKSHLLWLWHVVSALKHTGGAKRVVVDYDMLLTDPEKQLRRMSASLELPLTAEKTAEYAGQFLETGLRHTCFGMEDLKADESTPPFLVRAYSLFSGLADESLEVDAPETLAAVACMAETLQDLAPAFGYLDQCEDRISWLNATVIRRNESINRLEQAMVERSRQVTELARNVEERDLQIAAILSSTSWRVTKPLRWLGFGGPRVVRFSRNLARLGAMTVRRVGQEPHRIGYWLKTVWSHFLNGGMPGLHDLFARSLNAHFQPIAGGTESIEEFSRIVNRAADGMFTPAVLLIAELSIPQCKKYRVTQKKEMLESLGFRCSILAWQDTETCLGALQTHSVVIFYRTPAFPQLLALIAEAKRLRLQTFWEVDDLIFDRAVLEGSSTLARLDVAVRKGLLEGAHLYRAAMLACDQGIASTSGLVLAMKNAGLARVHLLENALAPQTMGLAVKRRRSSERPRQDGLVRIVYGSGTSTHDCDFLEVAKSVAQVLKDFPEARLLIIGYLELPEILSACSAQIERLEFCPYDEYLARLGACDISLAPLENYIFNDSKSNIKYLEASILSIPSLCSPRSAFRDVIVHGVNGYLCETEAEWTETLTMLIREVDLRRRIGAAARETVLARYAPDSIAARQLAPIFPLNPPAHIKRRILSVNVYYSPFSFGGATVVAEEMNKILNGGDEFEIFVLATAPASVAAPYAVKRYEAHGIPVFGLGIPAHSEAVEQFVNPHVLQSFVEVVDAVQPDLVHVHCLQTIGVSILDYCADKGIPYLVTLHDAWWLCARQFMVDKKGVYCGQETIDFGKCADCVVSSGLLRYRREKLVAALHGAALLLCPSRFTANFYQQNGFAEEKIVVNKNGIARPGDPVRLKRPGPIRFGYVGGNTEIKGISLVKKVFCGLSGVDACLVVVDNTLNLGFRSYDHCFFRGIANVEIVPAYTQETIDDFFASIDVLLFPSQWKESFGLTVREAIVRNVWVIATDAGGAVEDIHPGKNGLIVPFHDTGEGLMQAVTNTLEYFARIETGAEIDLEKAGIRWFEEQARELAGFYHTVLAAGQVPASQQITRHG
ncbi:MAG: glycosyltransferase [Proteobacteria bacterium]|nr:glycosyltransferase [Pseudomonadota bacterium]MBU4295736.1 glycosyltransferase [Pseudomonadota bacterium]MCG2747155.1 glycosyltransferase [Desulfobulbaceae bacterium]